MILTLAIAGLACQALIPIPLVYWSSVQYACQAATGGPDAWTVTAGTLPPGIVLDAVTGLLSPTAAQPNPPTGVTIEIAGEPTLAPEPPSEAKGTAENVRASNSAART